MIPPILVFVGLWLYVAKIDRAMKASEDSRPKS